VTLSICYPLITIKEEKKRTAEERHFDNPFEEAA
jgi:hypothetical protein